MREQYMVWTCDACRLPIGDREGYLHVDADEANQRMIKTREWRRKREEVGDFSHTLADLFTMPEDVPWLTHHQACDPRPDGPDYWIDIESARRLDQFFAWSLHVTEKNWVNEATNWHEFAGAAVDRFKAARLEVVR